MATLNLGRIKPVFQGAYNNSTAYVVDDIVTFGDETFICIQASTGNATSNASYWTKMAAKGTNGTNGTDVGTVITTQGDILYRDGSGLQRLAKGTAGQALKMNTAANAPEWGTISSDFVKIASGSHSGTALVMDNIFADGTTYRNFKVFINYAYPSSALYMRGRTGGASGTTYSGGDYRYRSYMRGWNSNNSDHDTGEAGWNHTYFRIGYTNTTQQNGDNYEITLANPNNTTHKLAYHHDNLFTEDSRVAGAFGTGYCNAGTGTAFTGLEFTSGSGSSFSCEYAVYGLKQ